MTDSSAHEIRLYFKVEGLTQEFRVLRFKGQEGLSTQFLFNLLLASEDSGVDLSRMVGQEALLTISGSEGDRHVHGMISRVQQRETYREQDWSYTFYQATLVPRAWRLRHKVDCRIFQDQTVEQIVSGVLEEEQISFKFHPSKEQLQQREYCVQFRESDWAFVCRLLEEEGYFYYFEHSAGDHVLHIGNDYQHHLDIPGEDTVPFHERDGRVPHKEFIYRYYHGQAVRSGKVTLDDFNFENPRLELRSEATADKETGLEVYHYPGDFQSQDEGARQARIRMQAIEATRQQGEGQSTCPRLSAGHYFVLDGHERRDLNQQKYLLTRVQHTAEPAEDKQQTGAGLLERSTSYHNEFACIPRSVPFRPDRLTPRPRIPGVQTALVQTVGGEEVDTDRHGRVHVKFHWDRRDRSDRQLTCWIRVSQGWAGQVWGSMYIPRDGDEVIVDFIDGDPDRPLVVGRVYHGHNVPAYSLPADKTKSWVKTSSSPGGGGHNEVRFEDRKGAEEFYTHAQKDQNEVIRANLSTTVGGGQSLSVGGGRKVKVGVGEEEEIASFQLTQIGSDQAVSINGDQYLVVGGFRDMEVAAFSKLKALVIDLVADSMIQLTSPRNVINGSTVINGDTLINGSLVVEAGKGPIVLNGGDVIINGNTVTVKGAPIKLNC